jgi:ubiquinone/menaquinone biosynthesis C-methylase UbiE
MKFYISGRLYDWLIEPIVKNIKQRVSRYLAMKYPQRSFICADAVKIPFKNNSFKGVLISFALHDKTAETRKKIVLEAQRLLIPGGTIVFVDFENPWNIRSKLGSILSFMIEKTAGGDHFRNNRQFLKQGGLRAFIQRHQLVEIERYDMELGAVAIVLAKICDE